MSDAPESDSGRRRRYGCEHKVAYATWSQATKAAKGARQKGRGAGHILAPYRCKFCSFYHLHTVDRIEKDKRRWERQQKEAA